MVSFTVDGQTQSVEAAADIPVLERVLKRFREGKST